MTRPRIGEFGVNWEGVPERNQVEFCKNWILKNTTKTVRYIRGNTSYGLKHMVEEDSKANRNGSRYYVSNGAFIQAAHELGYEWKQDSSRSPYVSLNLKSLKIG